MSRTSRARGSGDRISVVLSIALAGAVSVALSHVVAQERDEEERLEGTFTLAEPVGEARARVAAAIEQAASEVPFFMRGFARGRLADKNPVHERVQVELEGPRVVVSYGPDRYEAVEGEWTSVVARGEPTQLLVQRASGRLYQTFRTDEGSKRMVLTASPDGSRLWLDVEVTSERLESPMTYRLPYRRDGG